MNQSFASFSDGYGGDSHWFKCMIQIIIKDQLPEYLEKDGIRFDSFLDIIQNKNTLSVMINGHKHQKDLDNLYISTFK